MLRKKLTGLLVSVSLFVTMTAAPLSAAPDTVQGKLALVERDTYGTEQVGAVLERINRLETDMVGSHLNDNMMARVNALYERLYVNGEHPSELAQLNAIEWCINHEVSMTPIQKRLSDMEMALEGKTNTGTFSERIDALAKAAFGAAILPMEQVDVPADTLIKVALVTPVNAKTMKAGDHIDFKVAEDVIIGNCLVFAKGEPGEGTAEKVTQARNFGRDAEVKINFERTKSIDGTFVDTFVGAEAGKKMDNMAMAAGASIAGIVALGPVGIITGAFVNGKNVDIPAGTELYVQTKADSRLFGVRTKRDAL